MGKKVIESADAVSSCTNKLKDDIHNELGIIRNDIVTIPNPADLTNFYPTKKRLSNIILYCGSLEFRKGINILFKTIPEIVDKINDVMFYIVGKDTSRNPYNISTKEYLLDSLDSKYLQRVKFYGHVKYSMLNELYNSARIAVFPSLYDNLPYVALEAVATKTPLIGSFNSGMKEIIENSKSGLLYHPPNYKELAECILYIWNNPVVAQNYADVAWKNLIKNFDPIHIAEITLNLYKKTISNFHRG